MLYRPKTVTHHNSALYQCPIVLFALTYLLWLPLAFFQFFTASCCDHPTNHFTAIIQFNLRWQAPPVKNGRILLVQSCTAHMPLLAATSAFGSGRRCWQGGHRPGILWDFSDDGKLRELLGHSVQPQGKIVTNKVALV